MKLNGMPSLGDRYLHPDDAPRMHAAIDEAARRAERDPDAIARVVNVMSLAGEPSTWSDQLARIAADLRFSTLLVGVPASDPIGFIRRLGEEIAPGVRELVGRTA